MMTMAMAMMTMAMTMGQVVMGSAAAATDGVSQSGVDLKEARVQDLDWEPVTFIADTSRSYNGDSIKFASVQEARFKHRSHKNMVQQGVWGNQSASTDDVKTALAAHRSHDVHNRCKARQRRRLSSRPSV